MSIKNTTADDQKMGRSVGWTLSLGNDGPNIPRNEHTGCPDTFLPNDRNGARRGERERERMSRASGIDRYDVVAAAAAWVGSRPKRLTSAADRGLINRLELDWMGNEEATDGGREGWVIFHPKPK